MQAGAAVIRPFRKLRGRSVAELRTRGSQAAGALLERVRLSPDGREPGEREFRARLEAATFGATAPTDAAGLLDHFRSRETPRFFAAFDDPAATVAALRDACPDAAARILARADAARRGRFDLLGLRDVSFGDPIDWHLDPLSGRRAPERHWSRIAYLDPEAVGDHKLIWELNRHQHLATLGQAYWVSGDESYAETFAARLQSWMDANPPKTGINWASSLEVAFRTIAWLWALHFFRQSPALTPALFRRALGFLYVHGRHLERYLSTYFSPNTHLTGEALGLVYLGTLLPELTPARTWRELGQRILLEQLDRHVRPDGVYFEQSTYYHRYTTDFYTHFLLLRERNGLGREEGVVSRLQGLLDHLAYITRPDGRFPLIGDDDGGRLLVLDDRPPNDARAALSTGAALFGRGDYAFAARGVAEETIWLMGAEGVRGFRALEAAPPSSGSRAFADGGYYVMRSDWSPEADFAVVDYGPHGALTCGHAHADALALELVAGGRVVLADPGTYTYTLSVRDRDHFRGTAAHNTVTVDGEPSSVPAGPFGWSHVARASASRWISTPRFDLVDGAHDGYARLPEPATHARAVLFLKGDYWVLRDRIESRGTHRVSLHFQSADGVSAAIETGPALVLADSTDGRPLLRVVPFGANGGMSCERGWVSDAYARRTPACACTFSIEGAGPQEVVTFLLPAASIGAGASLREIPASGGRGFVIEHEEGVDTLLLARGRQAAVLRSEAVEADAEWVWVRWRGEDVSEFLLVGGRRLVADGVQLVGPEAAAPFVHGRRLHGDLHGDWLLESPDGALAYASPTRPPVEAR